MMMMMMIIIIIIIIIIMTLPITQFLTYCAITLKLTLREEIWIQFCTTMKNDLTFLIIITTSFTTLLKAVPSTAITLYSK